MRIIIFTFRKMDDPFNDIDFENETNNSIIDEESEPEIISDDDENKDSSENVGEKWRENWILPSQKIRFYAILNIKKASTIQNVECVMLKWEENKATRVE